MAVASALSDVDHTGLGVTEVIQSQTGLTEAGCSRPTA